MREKEEQEEVMKEEEKVMKEDEREEEDGKVEPKVQK